MKLVNLSKGVVLADGVEPVQTLFKKSKGLLGRVVPAALFFKTRWGIHTFGMKFPIDCVICDDDLHIKAVRENLQPNHLFFWLPKYKNVFELPAGTIQPSNTAVGDKVQLV